MRRVLAAVAVAASLMTAVPAHAEFPDLARALEGRLGRRTFIPFLGLARTLVRVVSPRGVHDFQLAVFEDAPRLEGLELQQLMERYAGKGFTPMVRVRSHEETTFVYARPGRGDLLELTVLTRDGQDTVLVRVTVDGKTLAREMGEPRFAARMAMNGDRGRGRNRE